MAALMEFLFLAILVSGATVAVRAVISRRAVSRRAELKISGSVKLPCRLRWDSGTSRKGFVYGKILANTNGSLTFSRLMAHNVPLPQTGWVHREPSWRSGLVILRYTVPGQGVIRILLSEEDADTVERLVRQPTGDSNDPTTGV
jgi:hypothetical protein